MFARRTDFTIFNSQRDSPISKLIPTLAFTHYSKIYRFISKSVSKFNFARAFQNLSGGRSGDDEPVAGNLGEGMRVRDWALFWGLGIYSGIRNWPKIGIDRANGGPAMFGCGVSGPPAGR